MSESDLAPFPEMENDEVRTEIDAAFSKSLGISKLDGLRTLLGQEPIVTSRGLENDEDLEPEIEQLQLELV